MGATKPRTPGGSGCPRLLAALTLAMALRSSDATAQNAADAGESDAGSPAVRVFYAWMNAFNSTDTSAKQAFIANHLADSMCRGRSVSELVARDRELAARVGGFELAKMEQATDAEVTALLRERAGHRGYARLHLELEPGNHQTVRALQISPVEGNGAEPARRLTGAELKAEVTKRLDQVASEDKFSGVVLMAKDAQILFARAYGYADRGKKARNTLETKFNLGSMNKMMTAVAVAQLVQSGKLKFADTVAQLLPDYPDRANAAKISVHHLLTHTSGLGDFFGQEYRERRASLHTLSDYLPLFAGKPLQFEPGSFWAYSNAGFLLLGLIIEKVSGKNYFDYVRKRIFEPAKMTHSGWYAQGDEVSQLAVGYTERNSPDGGRLPNAEVTAVRGTSAGGGYSTAGDLLNFSLALRAHQLLDERNIALLWSGKVRPRHEPDEEYGYGFSVKTIDGHRIIGHGGGAPGINADFSVYLDSGYTVIVLSNYDPPSAGAVAAFVQQRILL